VILFPISVLPFKGDERHLDWTGLMASRRKHATAARAEQLAAVPRYTDGERSLATRAGTVATVAGIMTMPAVAITSS
jgi:hypothetical protein